MYMNLWNKDYDIFSGFCFHGQFNAIPHNQDHRSVIDTYACAFLQMNLTRVFNLALGSFDQPRTEPESPHDNAKSKYTSTSTITFK